MRSRGNHQAILNESPQREVTRWLPVVLLLFSMWLLSGCVVTPIEAAGNPAEQPGSAATIAVAPISGVPGDTIFVSGAGWQANESVYVNLEQTPDQEPIQTTVAIATTDGEGRFTATFNYPVDPVWREPGQIAVVAYSVETDAQASAPFTVLESPPPTTTVTPTVESATATPTTTGQPPTTVTPTPQAGIIGVVVSSSLNVRTGPSTAFPIIRSIPRGTQFLVLGQNNSGAWLFVRLNDDTEGWLSRAYTDFSGIVVVVPSPNPPPPGPQPTATRPPQGSGWRGEYYDNPHLNGNPTLVRNDADINFDWGYGPPAPGLPSDFFSVRWVRSFYLPAGSYRFNATADDGIRVWVNGELVIDAWHLATGQTYSAVRQLDAASTSIRVEYYEATQIAKVRFWFEQVDQQNFPDWRGEYFSNPNLSGTPVLVRNDSSINFDWGLGSPAPNVPSDNFSVRWTRDAQFDAGTYRFHAVMDDGMRVFVDDSLIIDEWRNGSSREITRDLYLGTGSHRLRVEYYDATGFAVARFWWERIDNQQTFPDWKGEYWDNRDLSGDPRVVRNDGSVDFNWGSGSPDSRIPNDNFSARWTRTQHFDDDRYTFFARSDDGVRVWVGNNLIIDQWHDNSFDNTYSADIDLNGNVSLRVEYFEHTGGARIHVWWEKQGSSPTATPTNNAPYAQANPAQGATGTQVQVSGGGFPANLTVNLYLAGIVQASSIDQSSAQVRATTTTNGSGRYSMSFVIPNTWPDGSPVEPGKLSLLVATQDFGVQASAIFEVTGAPISGGNPSASISPSSGGPDTNVTVRGGGFPANTRVRAYLAGLATASAVNDDDMESIASTTTDGAGNYSLSFEMPDEWPNGDDIDTGKIIILIATDNFDVEASTDFNFFEDGNIPNPSLNLSPSSGNAGTSVRASGDGFPANTNVNLYLGALDSQVGGDAGDRIYASTRTDDNGNYSMSFTMPAQWPDGRSIPSGRVAVVVANSDLSVVTGGSFNFTATGTPAPTPTATNTVVAPTPAQAPSASVSPRSGGAGTNVTVSGNGFPANVTVNAYLAEFGNGGSFASDAVSYATATTDGTGHYSLSFVMPEEWPNGDNIHDGRVLIVIATNDFSRQASTSFSYNAVAAADAATATATPTKMATLAATATPVPTETPEATVVGEATIEPTVTAPVKPTAKATATTEATATSEPTEAATSTPKPTKIPAATNTPVTTDTPEPAATDTVAPTNTPVPPADTPTNTPVPPADTPTDTPVPPADTPTDTPTDTPVPPADTPVPPADTPTDTPVPPADTPTDTPVPPADTPTNTPVPPADTPTNTPVPPADTPTNTPVPPADTPTNTPVPPADTPTNTPVPPADTPTNTPPPAQQTEPEVTPTQTPVEEPPSS